MAKIILFHNLTVSERIHQQLPINNLFYSMSLASVEFLLKQRPTAPKGSYKNNDILHYVYVRYVILRNWIYALNFVTSNKKLSEASTVSIVRKSRGSNHSDTPPLLREGYAGLENWGRGWAPTLVRSGRTQTFFRAETWSTHCRRCSQIRESVFHVIFERYMGP